MKVKVHLINAFTESKAGGNVAGVVIDEYNLDELMMQKTAQIVGVSETAFIKKNNEEEFNVRFFTPNSEVDLCGHATIATFTLLKEFNIINTGAYTLMTKAGRLEIEVYEDGNIYMSQNPPKFAQFISKDEIKSCFNTDEEIFIEDLLPQIVSTGLKDIIVPIKDLNTLLNLLPDFEKIKVLSSKYNVIGIHAFTLESLNNSVAHVRNFAPLYGINEESATGTANAALSCYLFQHDKLTNLEHIIIEQGYIINQASSIYVKLKVKENNIFDVKVGGKANLKDEIYIEI